MDPNAWQQFRGFSASNRFGIPQHLLEQAASLSGISPPLTTNSQAVHGLPVATDNVAAIQATLAQDTNRLPPLASLSSRNIYEATPSAVVDPAVQSWNPLASWLKPATEPAVEPPPAHSNQRSAGALNQNPYRGRADLGVVTPAEQNLLIDHFENIRQQLQLLQEPPKSAAAAANIYGVSAASASVAAERVYEPQPSPTPTVPVAAHQQEIPKYSQQHQHQSSLQQQQESVAYKQHQSSVDSIAKQRQQDKYDSGLVQAHSKQVNQMKSGSYGGYTDNSPSSHNSSPHIAHSSPSLYSGQQPSAANQQPTYYNQNFPAAAPQAPSSQSFTSGGAAANIYEAVSPVATQQTIQQSYVQQQHVPSSVAMTSQGGSSAYDVTGSGGGHVGTQQQQQSSQIVQAQADSTTKPKKSRASKGGSRAGGGGRSKAKKTTTKSQEQQASDELLQSTQIIQQMNAAQTHPTMQQQQQQLGVAPHSQMPPLEHIQGTASVSMAAMSSSSAPVTSVTMGHHHVTSAAVPMQVLDTVPLYEVPGVNLSGGPSGAQFPGGSEDSLVAQMHMANDLLGIHHHDVIKTEENQGSMFPPHMSGGNGATYESVGDEDKGGVGTVEDNLGLGLATLDYRSSKSSSSKQKTKAEQKAMPQQPSAASQMTVAQRCELDDEFGHLSSDPTITKIEGTINPQAFAIKQEPGLDPGFLGAAEGATPAAPAPSKSKHSAFQSSFLSFIQGNKQETLSSVTNSTIMRKPELPKYIPEPPRPRPKPKVESPKKHAHHQQQQHMMKKNAHVSNGGQQRRMAPSSMQFSDDDDQSQASTSSVSKTVQGVISSLSKGDGRASGGSSTGVSPNAPLKLKIKMSAISLPPEDGDRPFKKRKSSSGKSSSSRKRSSGGGGNRRGEDDEYEVVALDLGEGPVGEQQEEEPSIPQRAKSSRKAKDKVEEKRRKRAEKKTKKDKKKRREEEEDFELSTDEEAFAGASDAEKGYDSDRDPGWMPGKEEFMGSGVSMKDVGMTPKGRPRMPKIAQGRRGGGGGGGPRGKRRFSSDDEYYEYSSDNEEAAAVAPAPPKRSRAPTMPQARPVVVDCDSDDNSPHHYGKGDFVMEKKELSTPEKFIIWRIDAGKLIQKYEPLILEDGTLVHKALSTYSSWSDILKPNYMGIEVDQVRIPGKTGDMVRVRKKYMPAPGDETLEAHTLMEPFNVFVQILLSESLEPSFLSLIRNPGEFDYYTGPLAEVEAKLHQAAQSIHARVQWQPEFKECVDKYPLLRILPKLKQSEETCTATVTGSGEAICKEAKLYGDTYDRNTLNKRDTVDIQAAKDTFANWSRQFKRCLQKETFPLGKTASEHLRRYHRLHHFKNRIYKKCLYMVECCRRSGKRETSDILDQCLQNRTWVQMLFREYMNLLGEPTHPTPPPPSSATAAQDATASAPLATANGAAPPPPQTSATTTHPPSTTAAAPDAQFDAHQQQGAMQQGVHQSGAMPQGAMQQGAHLQHQCAPQHQQSAHQHQQSAPQQSALHQLSAPQQNALPQHSAPQLSAPQQQYTAPPPQEQLSAPTDILAALTAESGINHAVS